MNEPHAPGAGRAEPLSLGDRIYALLTRVTSSGRFLPEIDGLRFVAIASVFLFHLRAFLVDKSGAAYAVTATARSQGAWLEYGNVGVQLFFAISGFVLALPFASHYLASAKPVRLSDYYLRRVTRIEPPYLINLLFIYAVMTLGGLRDAGYLFPHLIASLLYSHNLAYHEISAVNYVAWSLEVEVQFYLIAPFLARVFMVRSVVVRRSCLVGGILLAVALQQGFIGQASLAYNTILNHIQHFTVGFLLADLFVAGRLSPLQAASDAPPRLSVALWDMGVVAALLLLGAALTLDQSQTGIGEGTATHFVLPFVTLLFIVSTFRGALFRYLLTRRAVTVIGGMCYTIYLYHSQIISFSGRRFIALQAGNSFALNFIVQCALNGVFVFVVCAFLFLLFEKPFMLRHWPQKVAQSLFRRDDRDAVAGEKAAS